jgi:hypothetical protein
MGSLSKEVFNFMGHESRKEWTYRDARRFLEILRNDPDDFGEFLKKGHSSVAKCQTDEMWKLIYGFHHNDKRRLLDSEIIQLMSLLSFYF